MRRLTDEERRLTDEQRDVVEANLGLAGYFAKARVGDPSAAEWEDDFQASVLGLMRAVKMHDPSRGGIGAAAKAWCLREVSVRRRENHMIRVPSWAQFHHANNPDHKPVKPMARVDLGESMRGDPLAEIVAAQEPAEESADRAATVDRVRAMLAILDPDVRELVWRNLALGESYQTIAKDSGMTLSSVRRAVERARHRLQKHLIGEASKPVTED